jgi:predicted  nucleic acid-binding Zn-ribbon protein
MSLPEYGTHPIRCGRRACKWRGYETDMSKVPSKRFEGSISSVCPVCGCNEYMFMTAGEIKAWERKKRLASAEEVGHKK